jgi:hypothetical protein
MSRRHANVEIVAGDSSRCIPSIKSRNDKITRWDTNLELWASFSLPVNVPLTALSLGLDDSSKIIITVLRDSMRVFKHLKFLGKIDIELGNLLNRQHLHPNEGRLTSGWLLAIPKIDDLRI